MNKLGIRNQIKALIARNDTTTEVLDTFIDQAVAKIQRTLRVPAMEKSYITTITQDASNVIVIPNDFLRLKHLFTINLQRNYSIEYVDPARFVQTQDAPGNTPKIYTRIQGSLLLKPTPPVGTQVQMIYYSEIPDFTSDSDTTWLSELAPDLLVYTALSFAADYYIDDRKEQFASMAESAFQQLQDQAYEIEMSQEGLAVSTSFNGPEY